MHHFTLENCGIIEMQRQNSLEKLSMSCKWKRASLSLNIEEKIVVFDKTILNIFHNFISHETLIFDNRDPPWFN